MLNIITLMGSITAIFCALKLNETQKELKWYKEENERLKAEIESLKNRH